MSSEKESLELGPVSTGSMLKTSEGLLTVTMAGLCTTVLTGNYPVPLQICSLASLSLATSVYCLSRALSKKS
jgi:hypothetical protein